ncbi:MAG: asparagine synthase (glutamine-hydrolyzing) [Gammaproteobacteria bacterium]|nr:asparagine synthase (glutamine-hydrolyzing) [Gammaproteobacteria bacterium]MDH5799215.1 asparagine synthase (glutamine-hydrolyzing) [Gammaproteobacteria bacterium]
MCGLAGIYSSNKQAPFMGDLKNMVRQLSHRGPDGTGFIEFPKIGLAHARLSIIDLEGGSQPIHNEDKSIWVVFNGEIFNFPELRQQLIQQGHLFYTHTDTEVIVHLYEQYGETFVEHLNGQFAIALWDNNSETLFLTRDRVGIVPLFYQSIDNRLLFASEVKSLLATASSSPSLNTKALDQLMTFWAPVSPNTIFSEIQEVSPGEMLRVKNGDIKHIQYWDWSFSETQYRGGDEDSLAGELHDLLIDATKIRLRSDVPVGAYLSGGLDSSVIVAILKHYGGVPLRTFSIGFDSEEFDEGSYQKALIAHLGTDHSAINCSNSDIADSFVDTIWHTESPILRTAPVPMRRLSGLVKQENYKVVLTGEGSDEVLGGYDIFKEGKIRQFWAKNPDSSFRAGLLKKLYPYLDISQGRGQAYLKQFFGADLDKPDLAYFAHIPRWNTTAKIKEFFSDDVKQNLNSNALEDLCATLPGAIHRWHPFNRSQYIEAKSLMAGYLLCSQGDRMLLSNSVEGRFPFLDHRVIEFANTLHPKYKMKALNEKFLLKKAFRKYLPPKIVSRYKQPYRAPDIAAFFGGEVPEYVHELLGEKSILDAGYFDSNKVGRLKKKIEKGRAIGYKDNMALVGILSTQVWHYHFIKNFNKNFGN